MTISRIALIAPPANQHIESWLDREVSHVRLLHATHLGIRSRTFIGENLGLHIAAAAFESMGYATAVFDACLHEWSIEDLVQRIIDYRPDCMCLYTLDGVLSEISAIAEKLKVIKGMLVAVGPAAVNASAADTTLGVDLVWGGDAPGFARWAGGIAEANATVPFSQHPWPVRTDSATSIAKGLTLGIASSRGCAFGRCRFCTIAANSERQGYRWQAREADDVVDEFMHLADTYAPGWITFADADFIGDHHHGRARALEIARKLVRRGNQTSFMIDCRMDQLDRELLLNLRTAGLKQVFVGIEHGTGGALGRLGKGLSLSSIHDGLDMLRDLEIDFIPGYITFLPWETPEEVMKSFRFFRSLDYYDLWRGTSFLRLYEGTPLAATRPDGENWQRVFQVGFAPFLKRALISFLQIVDGSCAVSDAMVAKIACSHYDTVEALLTLFSKSAHDPAWHEIEAIVLPGALRIEELSRAAQADNRATFSIDPRGKSHPMERM